jgi:hypothetical protein
MSAASVSTVRRLRAAEELEFVVLGLEVDQVGVKRAQRRLRDHIYRCVPANELADAGARCPQRVST